MTEKQTLERITVVNNEIVDSHGNKIKAEPVSELDLVFIDRVRQHPEEVIQNLAPENTDFYMESKHSFNTNVGYKYLGQDKAPNAPEISIFAVQYWRRK